MVNQLSQQQRDYLQLMGITVWQERGNDFQDEKSPETLSDNNDEWSILRQKVSSCVKCVLHERRTQTVFGVGNSNADWLIIGEAPGAEEDKQGEPFVGRAGQLLDSMLAAMGLSRAEVFIANILKCRPPENRDPRPEEVEACESYLSNQIKLIQPKIILAVGRIAAQNLLKVDTPIGKMRGKLFEYPELKVPVVVTYHPAYLLRSPKEKRKTWQDLQLALRVYKEQV
jgi:uracil-DNA glycosylase family 4